MSTLTQFFGRGGGSIPTEVVIVNGGSGASCACGSNNAPYCGNPITGTYVQGRGGAVAASFFNIEPGTTCSVTVGAGGSSLCRPFSCAFTICPYKGYSCSIVCCLGGSGCASKFGSFGGTDRTQISPACTTCNMVLLPYDANYPVPFCANTLQNGQPCNGTDYYCTTPGFLSVYGHFGGSNLKSIPLSIPSAGDIIGARGYVSKITGTVQTYGAAKEGFVASANCPCSAGFGRPHPNSIGTGSGHGAYYCDSGIVAAAPGTVVIQYPDDFDAATTSSPNVCDCSPATPGFKTYRFLCPGSIIFP